MGITVKEKKKENKKAGRGMGIRHDNEGLTPAGSKVIDLRLVDQAPIAPYHPTAACEATPPQLLPAIRGSFARPVGWTVAEGRAR